MLKRLGLLLIPLCSGALFIPPSVAGAERGEVRVVRHGDDVFIHCAFSEQDDTSFDFRAIQNYSLPLKSPIQFGEAQKNIEDPKNPPERFTQFLERHRGERAT